ncbi:MAG TPA: Gfo/Idh/MocA family oxidoreductase [Dongiaceae bacterium]|nr:Gfo/Idh/MocA family oxidoreductase [Dongiaceae bacterium]
MAERIGVAVVGCGFFAQNHLNAWRDLKREGVELVAVCDIDKSKAEAAAKNFDVPKAYADLDEMLAKEKIGLIDIVTRVETHKEQVLKTVAKGIPTIVQKPFAFDLADCRTMTLAAKKAGVPLAVHENFRFQSPLRRITELLRQGVIGEPSWGRVSFRSDYDIYAGQPYLLNETRFVISDLGVHVCDVARAYLGEVDRVSCETQNRNPRAKGEDTATIMMRHTNGAVSISECTYGAHRVPNTFPQSLIELEGTKGSIILNANYELEIAVDGKVTKEHPEADVLPWAAKPWHVVQESVVATCEHILKAFRAKKDADVSAEDNFKTFACCEAAYASAESGKAVKPEAL